MMRSHPVPADLRQCQAGGWVLWRQEKAPVSWVLDPARESLALAAAACRSFRVAQAREAEQAEARVLEPVCRCLVEWGLGREAAAAHTRQVSAQTRRQRSNASSSIVSRRLSKRTCGRLRAGFRQFAFAAGRPAIARTACFTLRGHLGRDKIGYRHARRGAFHEFGPNRQCRFGAG